MTKEEIYKTIPHRPPFLFVDEVSAISENKIQTIKRVEPEESFFKGHYPDHPIMPGVLICESIFQSGAILIARKIKKKTTGLPVLTKIEEARFRRMVKPGDVLEIEVEIVETLQGVYFLKGKAMVSGKVVISVRFACTVIG